MSRVEQPEGREGKSQVQRLRVWFAKGPEVRWIGHLDVARFWERAIRRADIPILYSRGFNPQPRVQFASALPVGVSGRAEIMDIWVSPPQDPTEVKVRLQAQCPPAFRVLKVREVSLDLPSLQSQVRGAEYEVMVEKAFLPPDWQKRVKAFLAATEVWRERRRKGKQVRYNLRPLVQELRLLGEDDEWVRFFLRVRSEEGATGRPDELLAALGLEEVPRRIERTRILFQREGQVV